MRNGCDCYSRLRPNCSQYQAKPAPPTAPTATSPAEVQRYLGSNQEFNPDYAVAVLNNFVRASLETGVEGAEVATQLDDLERRVSQTGRAQVVADNSSLNMVKLVSSSTSATLIVSARPRRTTDGRRDGNCKRCRADRLRNNVLHADTAVYQASAIVH